MKIVLVGPTYPFRGGISHYTTLLYRYLAVEHDVTFISFKRQYPVFLFPGKTDRDNSRTPFIAPSERLLDPLNPVTWYSTVQRIRKKRPELVLLQWWVPYWAPAFATVAFFTRRLTSAKVLFICHNVIPHEKTSFSKWLGWITLRHGQTFIVHSEKDIKDLKKLLPEAQVQKTILPTYQVFAEFQEASFNKTQTKSKLNNKRIILFFGFIRAYKGLKYLLRALPKIIEAYPVHLLIVGEFWEDKTQYVSLIEDLQISEHVTIIDEYVPNEEVGRYFSMADVVVLPYVNATQSAIIQIAFGFKKPVITTKVGGLAEVVRDDETGLIVPPANSQALAQAIIRFFKEDLSSKFQKNIEISKSNFDWENLVEVIVSMGQNQERNQGASLHK